MGATTEVAAVKAGAGTTGSAKAAAGTLALAPRSGAAVPPRASTASSVCTTVIAGVGFMADAYDLFVIDVVKNMMAQIYPQTTQDAANLGVAALVGSITGQLVFGAIGDRLGRRTAFIVTLALIVLGSLGSATVTDGGAVGIYTQLCLWRGVLGFGVGGEYPLAASITAEGASSHGRGRALASVFAMQGVGKLMAASVNSIVTSTTSLPLDAAWRISLALGAAPGLLTLYWRWQMEESEHYTRLTTAATATSPIATAATATTAGTAAAAAPATGISFAATAALLWHYRWRLLGTAGCWFLIDVTFYGQGLFSGTVLHAAGVGGAAKASMTREELTDVAIGSLILVCIALPGYFVSIFTVDGCMGRRGVQFMGFAASTVVFLTLGAAYKPLVAVPGAFIFLYGLTYFFANWGANTSTFLMPAESFPTRARATAHGISAATGKLGATLGSYGLPYLLVMYGTDADSKARGLVVIMYVCAGVCALGVVWTLLTVETRGLVFETMDAHHETSSVTGGAPSCDDASSDDVSVIVAAAAAIELPTRAGTPLSLPASTTPPSPSMAPPSPPAVVTMPDTTATAPPSPPV